MYTSIRRRARVAGRAIAGQDLVNGALLDSLEERGEGVRRGYEGRECGGAHGQERAQQR